MISGTQAFAQRLQLNPEKEFELQHVLTIQDVNTKAILGALQSIRQQHKAVNSKNSRLRDLIVGFGGHFRFNEITTLVHANDKQYQESWLTRHGEFEIKLTVMSYHESVVMPSMVKNAHCVNDINKLRTHFAAYECHTHSDLVEHISAFAHKCFVVCADTASFETDIDDGLWTIWFCDKRGRTTACLELTHRSLLEDQPTASAKAKS